MKTSLPIHMMSPSPYGPALNVVGYARYSSDMQDPMSTWRQIKKIKEYASARRLPGTRVKGCGPALHLITIVDKPAKLVTGKGRS